MPHDTDATPTPPARVNGRSWPSAVVLPTSHSVPSTTESAGDGDRWTVGRLITWTADYLKKHGSESPRLDAEVLLANALGWQRVQLYTRYEEEVGERPRSEFKGLVRRRAEGAPVAYLVGRKEFYSLPFKVDPSVLIPRPDSEFVVVEVLAALGKQATVRGIDIGTGSGCLALACAREMENSRWIAIDISAEALAVATHTQLSK